MMNATPDWFTTDRCSVPGMSVEFDLDRCGPIGFVHFARTEPSPAPVVVMPAMFGLMKDE